MNAGTQRRSDGRAGRPDRMRHRRAARRRSPLRGVAVLCHPHPLHGGTMDNKVVQTHGAGLRATGPPRGALQLPRRRRLRPAAGTKAAARWTTPWPWWPRCASPALPLVLGGFSFGAYVTTQAAARLPDSVPRRNRLVLVGPAVVNFPALPVSAGHAW